MAKCKTARALPLHSNTKKATLLGCIDRTVTAAGGRLLKDRLSSPLVDIQAIEKRLAAVELFSREVFHAENIVSMLKSCEDLERIIQKVATGCANITDLQAIKGTLCTAGEIVDYISQNIPCSEALEEDMKGLIHFTGLVEELDNALSGVNNGDYIMAGYSEEVDLLRTKMKENEHKLYELVKRLQDNCGLTRLTVAPHKIYTRVLETTKLQAAKAEKCKELVEVDRTQSKKRFSNTELQALNTKLQRLEMSYCSAQDQLFKDLCDKVLSQAEEIKQTARSIARLDVSTSLGLLANERTYCKPEVVNDPVYGIDGGVHPVVAALQQSTFISNDCDMDEHRLWIVTGPNMGGKSTFLRQNALIAILAQMGSFVPAKKATLGVVDRLFARVGASDNVAKHMSTFHMEMTETANILTNATSKSFVILDEIGRGTSTSEGLSIAQAVVEHLHNHVGSRTLVATHFHQLVALCSQLQNAGCYKLVAEKDDSGIVFTYQIKPGHVDHSFAIEVARLAGIPDEVITRAEDLLSRKQHRRELSNVLEVHGYCHSNSYRSVTDNRSVCYHHATRDQSTHKQLSQEQQEIIKSKQNAVLR